MLREQFDILGEYSSRINFEEIEKLRQQRGAELLRPHWDRIRQLIPLLPTTAVDGGPFQCNLTQARVQIGDRRQLDAEAYQTLTESVKELIPWRKGPFDLFGLEIDAEWQSDHKWDRILPYLPPLRNRKVADIGCNNGYYMFRLLEHEPRFVIGLEPSERCYFSFELIQRFLQEDRLQFELLGVEHMDLFEGLFDVVFCMGILYHHRNPIALLQKIQQSMSPGGHLVVESQGIPGTESIALFPEDRYAKMRNVYFLPTASCLAAWVKRSGFVDVEIVSNVKLTTEEQRQTVHSPFESLPHYLCTEDPSRTVEGHPAPQRIVVTARKRKNRNKKK